MTDSERFEVLWLHHQRQIDENRAVHQSLEELRGKVHWMTNIIEQIQININDVLIHLEEKR